MEVRMMRRCESCKWEGDEDLCKKDPRSDDFWECPKCDTDTITFQICTICDDEVRRYDGRCSCDFCNRCDENVDAGNCGCEEEEE
jgi:hypothetical protein